MFNALSTSTQTKLSNLHSKQTKSSTTTITSANPLDSNPAPKRGKEREDPKPRKPTKLKRIINKELEENQKQRQQLLTKPSAIQPTEEYVHFELSLDNHHSFISVTSILRQVHHVPKPPMMTMTMTMEFSTMNRPVNPKHPMLNNSPNRIFNNKFTMLAFVNIVRN